MDMTGEACEMVKTDVDEEPMKEPEVLVETTSSGTGSLASVSSGAENISPMLPSSSGYSSENPGSSDKQGRKKQLQQCLREIKHFVGTQLTGETPKKLDTLEALIKLLNHLKNQMENTTRISTQPRDSKIDLPTGSHDPVLPTLTTPIVETKEELLEVAPFHLEVEIQVRDGLITVIETKNRDDNFFISSDFINKSLKEILDSNDPKTSWLYNEVLQKRVGTIITHCRIRGSKKMESAIEDVVSPCQIVADWTSTKESADNTVTLRLSPVKHAYDGRTSVTSFGHFATRHSPNCRIIQTDFCISGYLGYLPQEIVGKSYLSFVHPEDFVFIKECHEQILKAKGKPLKSSKPYRMRVRNNDFVQVETEWSSFANPWSKQVEFIIARHSVLSCPANDNIFADPTETLEPGLKQQMDMLCKTTEEWIVQLMSRPTSEKLRTLGHNLTKKENSQKRGYGAQPGDTEGHFQANLIKPRRKDFCAYMDNFIEELARDSSRAKLSVRGAIDASWHATGIEGSPQSTGDVISGSPPQSSGSGPTYYQMNYNDNIRRYFDSQPKTHSSDEGSPTGKPDSHKPSLSPVQTRHEDLLPSHQLLMTAEKPNSITHTIEVTRRPNSNISDTPITTEICETVKEQQKIKSHLDDLSAQMFIPNFFKWPNVGYDRSSLPQSRDIPEVNVTAGRRVPLPDSSSSSRETPNVTISLMHRCQSAAADLTHCRPLGALTKELVQKHTYEQEMAYMRSWKRRKSAETNQVNGVTTGTKRPLEPCPDSDEPYSPFKIPRQESQLDTAYNFTGRPASMPVLQHLQQYYTTEAGGSADRVIHRSPERNVTIEHYSSNRRFGSNLSSFVPEERRSQALQVAQNFLLPMTNFTTNLNNNNNNIDKTVEPFKIQPAAKVSISSDPHKSAFAPPAQNRPKLERKSPEDFQPINLSCNRSFSQKHQQSVIKETVHDTFLNGVKPNFRLQADNWDSGYSRTASRQQEFSIDSSTSMSIDDLSSRRYQVQPRLSRDAELLQRLNQPQLLITQQQEKFYAEMQLNRFTSLPQETSTAVKEATDTLLFLENS